MSSKIRKKDRDTVFAKFDGLCAYCGDPLVKGWHVDHIEPMVSNMDGTHKYPERNILQNYNPACASCNILKSSYPMEEFRRIITGFINSLNLRNTQYKFAKRYGLVKELPVKVRFHFENVQCKHESQEIVSYYSNTDFDSKCLDCGKLL